MPRNVQAELSRSVWMPVPDMAGGQADGGPLDLVVIGSGIAGLSIAYEALLKGRRVTVLDRGAIASGMTARTTAHLASALDDFYHLFMNRRSEEDACQLHQSLAAAIDRVEQIVRVESFECDFQRCNGFLFLGEGDKPILLEREIAACHQIGFAGVSWEATAPLPDFDTGRCLRFPNQARFHPLKYLHGLAKCIVARGGVLRPHTAVKSVSQEGDRVLVELADGHTIGARDVVCATNSSIAGPVTLHTKMAPYRTYAMAFSIPKGAIPDALYWDTLDPYHYVRLQPGDGRTDFLIVGGGDHKSGEADDADVRFQALEAWTRNLIPAVKDVTHRWSGQVLDTIDYAGFIGRNPRSNNIYVHTGDSGQGMTHGVVGAMINSALILGREAKWAEVYEPSRKPLAGMSNFLRENMTAVKNFAEYLAPGELSDVSDLKAGHGAIIRQGMSKIAAYRDPSGRLYARSAACTHVGCHLHWNSFETCWDCPCHGSHFAIDGTPLNAPAIGPLAEADIKTRSGDYAGDGQDGGRQTALHSET